MATVPNAPSNILVIPGPRRLTVNFTAPEDDGGSPVTGYVASVESMDGQTGSIAFGPRAPVVIAGVQEDVFYTVSVRATNAQGDSEPSPASAPVTPMGPTTPNPPSTVSGLPQEDGSVLVHFSPPADDGGASVLSYKATAINEIIPGNGGQTATGIGAPLLLTGLSPNEGYTFVVQAINQVGASELSEKSPIVIPTIHTPEDSVPPPLDNAHSFSVSKHINIAQLVDELKQATSSASVNAAMVEQGDTVTLWVAPLSLSSEIVEQTIQAHVPDAAYGVSPEEAEFTRVVQKILTDREADLSSDEMQALVKGWVWRGVGVNGAF